MHHGSKHDKSRSCYNRKTKVLPSIRFGLKLHSASLDTRCSPTTFIANALPLEESIVPCRQVHSSAKASATKRCVTFAFVHDAKSEISAIGDNTISLSLSLETLYNMANPATLPQRERYQVVNHHKLHETIAFYISNGCNTCSKSCFAKSQAGFVESQNTGSQKTVEASFKAISKASCKATSKTISEAIH